ncbi:hypothetical protein [Roseateles sp. P5_E7]
MEAVLDRMLGLPELHFQAGKAVFNACGTSVFPCDALALAVLERSLGLIKGFQLLARNGCYTAAVALLRMQLDNALRLHGVASTADPHDTACQIVNGTPLRKLKDSSGQPMNDKRLTALYSVKRAWAQRVYDVASAYVHLSDTHVSHFVARSPKVESGSRHFSIGDDDDHVPRAQKLELVEAFEIVTLSVLEEVRDWAVSRDRYGDLATLKLRYGLNS